MRDTRNGLFRSKKTPDISKMVIKLVTGRIFVRLKTVFFRLTQAKTFVQIARLGSNLVSTCKSENRRRQLATVLHTCDGKPLILAETGE